MTVSVVIPTFEREQVLVDTLSALLEREGAADEILVVDETEQHEPETRRFLEAAEAAGRVRWLRHRQPSGQVGKLNRGLREAHGDIVLFLDDDVVPGIGLVAAHCAVYAQFPEAWAVVGQVIQPDAGSRKARCRDAGRTALRRDLDFDFGCAAAGWVENVITCNLSVRREQVLALGGFDEKFLPPVSFRAETDLAKRIIAAGGRIRFAPTASLRHVRAARGGTRTAGSHLASASPDHGVGDYYYALKHGRGGDRVAYILRRPFREVCTKFHLRHPWWIPVKLVGEARALWQAGKIFFTE
jgi:GT2 family glycosyltransferase